jgi:hypothetical protein
LDNWRLGVGVFAGFLIWVLLVSLVALAGSAYVRWRVVAGGIVLAFFFVLAGVSGMVNGVFRVTWGSVLNPAWAAERLWCAMLDVEPLEGPGVLASAAMLLALALLLGLVLERKLRPVEVIS